MTTIGKLPFEVALAIVAGLALVMIVVGDQLGLGYLSLLLLAVPVAVAVWYLLEFRKLPMKEHVVPPASTSVLTQPSAISPEGAPLEATPITEAIIPMEEGPTDEGIE